MRVVFDTNVLIAAFLTEGVCSKLLVRARRREFELFLSTDADYLVTGDQDLLVIDPYGRTRIVTPRNFED